MGLLARTSKAIYNHADGVFRANLDLEFASTLTHIDLALVYGLALPIVLPLAALSMATHAWVFDRLLRQQSVVALPCAAAPAAYLQVPLVLQAALGAWFFCSTESVGVGVGVGVMALLGAVLFNCGGRGRAALRRGVAAHFVANERGVRLTVLRPGVRHGCDCVAGGGNTATNYSLMT